MREAGFLPLMVAGFAIMAFWLFVLALLYAADSRHWRAAAAAGLCAIAASSAFAVSYWVVT